jgi:hypothetical protein
MGIGALFLFAGVVLGLVALGLNSYLLVEGYGVPAVAAYLLLCTGPLVMLVLPVVALVTFGAWHPLLVNWGSLALSVLGGQMIARRRR